MEAQFLPNAGCVPAAAQHLSSARDAAEIEAHLRHCFLPRLTNGRLSVVTGDTSAANLAWLQARYGTSTAIGLQDRRDVLAAIEKQFRDVFLRRAVRELAECEPQFSASTTMMRGQAIVFSILAAAILFAAIMAPHLAGIVLSMALAMLFAANAVFRAFLLWIGEAFAETAPPVAPIPDEELPIYSVLVPLYREANVLPSLIASMKMLGYPAGKLDIILVVEADDLSTFEVAEPALSDSRFSIIRVPEGGPRTKPRACNYALFGVPFCAEFREAA